MDELVKAAVGAIFEALTKAAVEPALSGGRKIWEWIKGRTSVAEAAIVTAVEANPSKPSAPSKVTALLQDLLQDNPEAAEELKHLMESAGIKQAIQQTANTSGDGNRVFQLAGTGNSVRTG